MITRLTLHQMLLSEAYRVVIGPELACPNCRSVGPSIPFCTVCGIARRATPKLGRLLDDASKIL